MRVRTVITILSLLLLASATAVHWSLSITPSELNLLLTKPTESKAPHEALDETEVVNRENIQRPSET